MLQDNQLPTAFPFDHLPKPEYIAPAALGPRLVLGVSSMKDHMTDEGWQLTHGLALNGYIHCGHGLPEPITDVARLLDKYNPSVVVVQDKREWGSKHDFRDPLAKFNNVHLLRDRPDIFKVTVIKDAQQRPYWHRESSEEIGCNAWIHYYHRDIVMNLQPYIRPLHMIRTWHTVNPDHVTFDWSAKRSGTLLSGAISNAYPFRQKLSKAGLPIVQLRHPGYHRKGCATPGYLKLLTDYKVAICTASRFGYALRKIIEATAAGCIVVTDLPVEDKLPFGIDGNLVRVHPDISMADFRQLIVDLEESWNEETQRQHAENAIWGFDYRRVTSILAQMIEVHRLAQSVPEFDFRKIRSAVTGVVKEFT